jgi:hypothetical protein
MVLDLYFTIICWWHFKFLSPVVNYTQLSEIETVHVLILICLRRVQCTKAEYVNIRQRKLGIIVIQTVHVLQFGSADTGSLPEGEFCMGNPIYFQVT